MTDHETLRARLDRALADRALDSSAHKNVQEWLRPSEYGPEVLAILGELVELEAWRELNDRFYAQLEFGTGGMRGRTIGRVIAPTEQGDAPPGQPPRVPAIGSTTLNFYNIRRATIGLCIYTLRERRSSGRVAGRPTIVIAHDTRHFSHAFAETAADVAVRMGLDAIVFPAERSTPQLSFSVREYGADAGVVITASHNPYHDNGYKVYYRDGAQVVRHADGIIAEVQAVTSPRVPEAPAPGSLRRLDAEADGRYRARLHHVVLEPAALRVATRHGLKIVYTPLHGTGARIIPDVLRELGCAPILVAEQAAPDGGFPTVASPNPENQAALTMAIALAEREKAALVIGTDPDADRLGAGAPDASGQIRLLTGNQLGSVLAHYRLERLQSQGRLAGSNAIIKTIVTTDLQAAIAAQFGVKCVETLTGFKYIGEKLEDYEQAGWAAYLARCRQEGRAPVARWHDLNLDAERGILQTHSTFYVFGGEESYGYSGADFVRDKDANMSAVMLVELVCSLEARGLTLHQYLDDLYAQFGYFEEKPKDIFREGATGQAQIEAMMDGLRRQPPETIGCHAVTRIDDYARDEIRDADGKRLPPSNVLGYTLEDGCRVVVRPSGTERKIKFYLLGRSAPPPAGTRLDPGALAAAKERVRRELERIAGEFVPWVEAFAGK